MSVIWVLIFIFYPISLFVIGFTAFYFGYRYALSFKKVAVKQGKNKEDGLRDKIEE